MTTTNLEIETLVRKAKNGDETAFGRLYEIFSAKIFRFIRIKISNKQDAEDLSQTVFFKSYQGLKSLRPGKINFPGWLFKIAANSINDYFRKTYRSPMTLSLEENFDPPDSRSVEKEALIKSDFELARKVFAGLPPLYRKILELRLLLDRPLEEVAQNLNKTTTSVRVAQCRALKKARVVLSQADNLR